MRSSGRLRLAFARPVTDRLPRTLNVNQTGYLLVLFAIFANARGTNHRYGRAFNDLNLDRATGLQVGSLPSLPSMEIFASFATEKVLSSLALRLPTVTVMVFLTESTDLSGADTAGVPATMLVAVFWSAQLECSLAA